ncbi:MAG: epoxyqueuosine reductase QueH [Patescibacteria group bacterium]|jgi:predicted adenine nucleotide alpha hydrolase (AANH) superfamily ATPase
MTEIAENNTPKPTLLLHACCAPCSTSVYERLSNNYDLTVYWYNPNIFPFDEHNKRLEEIKKLSGIFDFALVIDPETTNHQQWNSETVQRLSTAPEGGARCWLCYHMRLEKVAKYAVEKGFSYFSSTLSVSPHKNAAKIIEIGKSIETKTGPRFLAEDFKKKDGYKRSIEISKELNLYRQDYCGCEYSLALTSKTNQQPRVAPLT